ncbi:TraB/GumN family protein [Flavobacterium sp.]|uniref:TraB/GumN family protein n=1 Tax=Flavobacterium sp. TaxID=239 RepID=UPI002632B087|nr:TraB/GumN family protein [Flavobacterium sp.]MDG2432946.1 TraB/GumN family protein [Flavobacterium sp.]
MKYYFFLLFFLFNLSLYSQENSIFWKIEKDSITSYLLGTDHLFGKSFIDRNEKIIMALKSSQLVFTENIKSADSIVNSRNSSNIIENLTSDEKNKLLEIFDKKVNINNLSLKELILTTDKYWSIFSCFSNKERKDKILMDDYIKKLSSTYKIKLVGLEDISETLNFLEREYLNGYTDEKLISILKYKLDGFSKNLAHNNCSIHELYRNKLYNFNFNDVGDTKLLDSRNFIWIPKIISELENKKKVFIAVGIAHLDYKNGLIEQLKQKGYTITQIIL